MPKLNLWNHKISAGDILLLLISVIFLIGVLTIFKPCAPSPDGNWMACHWAGQAVAGLAAVLVIISLAHMILSDAKIKTGLNLAVIPVAVLAMILPGHLISLCVMDFMRCHSVTRPAVIVMSVLTIAAAVYNILSRRNL